VTVEVQVWNAANDTMLAVLSRRWGVQWQDSLNESGVGSVTVHADDPAANETNLSEFNIIRFVYQGAVRFAWRIERRNLTVVGSGGEAARVYELSGRGLLSLISDARLYPEYGIARLAGTDRYFNFGSAEGDWYDAADWGTPVGVRQDSRQDNLSVYPLEWPDPAAQWIWSSDPDLGDGDTSVPAGTVNWFRGEFTLASETNIRVYLASDNYRRVFLDGELIDDSGLPGYTRASEVDLSLAAGTHLLAAEVKQREQLTGATGDDASFIATVAELASDATPSAILFRTNTTNWTVATVETGWQPHHILAKIVTEAQGRSVLGPDSFTLGFTASTDSDGTAWTTDIMDRSFRVGEDCLSVATTLCEDSEMDVWMDPANMVLEAWQGRGTDRSTGAEVVALRPGQSITDMKILRERPVATRLLTLTENGWYEEADSAQESAIGRVEGWAELGGSYTAAEAQRQALNILGYFAQSSADASVGGTDLAGPKPYVDFDVADTVLAPDGFTAGSFAAYRVMSLSFTEQDDGTVQYVAELDGA
jgi:hypothetical protein